MKKSEEYNEMIYKRYSDSKKSKREIKKESIRREEGLIIGEAKKYSNNMKSEEFLNSVERYTTVWDYVNNCDCLEVCELGSLMKVSDVVEYARLCLEEYKEGLRSEEAESYIQDSIRLMFSNGVSYPCVEKYNAFHALEINSQYMIDKAITILSSLLDEDNDDDLSDWEIIDTLKQKLMEGKG